jgi:hypothetical protein
MAKAGQITVNVVGLETVKALIADLEARYAALESAATRVVQLVTHGADGLVVGEAIAEMRRVLDGGGQ